MGVSLFAQESSTRYDHLTNALSEAGFRFRDLSFFFIKNFFFKEKCYKYSHFICFRGYACPTLESTTVERVWGHDGYFIKLEKGQRLWDLTFELILK